MKFPITPRLMSNNLESTKIIFKDYYNWQAVARSNARREQLRLLLSRQHRGSVCDVHVVSSVDNVVIGSLPLRREITNRASP